jgi:hypothetical protein
MKIDKQRRKRYSHAMIKHKRERRRDFSSETEIYVARPFQKFSKGGGQHRQYANNYLQ